MVETEKSSNQRVNSPSKKVVSEHESQLSEASTAVQAIEPNAQSPEIPMNPSRRRMGSQMNPTEENEE